MNIASKRNRVWRDCTTIVIAFAVMCLTNDAYAQRRILRGGGGGCNTQPVQSQANSADEVLAIAPGAAITPMQIAQLQALQAGQTTSATVNTTSATSANVNTLNTGAAVQGVQQGECSSCNGKTSFNFDLDDSDALAFCTPTPLIDQSIAEQSVQIVNAKMEAKRPKTLRDKRSESAVYLSMQDSESVPRKWADGTLAKIREVVGSNYLIMETSDGELIAKKLEKLSKSDREYVTAWCGSLSLAAK